MLKFFRKMHIFYIDVLENAKKISWPEKNQAIYLSFIVIFAVIVLSLFCSGIDFFINRIVYFLIKLPLF